MGSSSQVPTIMDAAKDCSKPKKFSPFSVDSLLGIVLVKAPFKGKSRGQWPESHILHLIGLNFRGFIFCGLWISFLDSVTQFGFLSKLYGTFGL